MAFPDYPVTPSFVAGNRVISETGIKRYVVRRGESEWETLRASICNAKHVAGQVVNAVSLLKAEISEAGEGWSDESVTKSSTPVPPPLIFCRRLVEPGCKAVLPCMHRERPSDLRIFVDEAIA